MVSSYTKDFNVTWADPADGQQTWMFDPMHLPHPMCRLVADYWDRMFVRYMNSRTAYVNGYGFSTVPMPRPPTEEMMKRGIADVWANDYLPRIKTTCDKVRKTNYEPMSLAELGGKLDQIVEESVVGFGYTMKPITAFMGPTFGFVEFLRNEIGDDGPRLGATLLQGFENGTAAAGAGLSRMADEAAKRPAVADALRKGDFESVEKVEGGKEFIGLFHEYLEDFGWRVDSWGLMDRPTWAENPTLPLTMIGHYINDPARSPAASIKRSKEQRDEAQQQVETKLSADKLPQFRELLETCQAHVPISEGRALWQLISVGSLRVPFLALGKKLVAAGALDRPEQVFHFSIGELKDAASAPNQAMKKIAAEREAEFKSWHELTPPPFIGAPPDPTQLPPEVIPLLTLFFGVGEPSVENKEIKGQAASKGVVTAKARVLMDLDEADKLQPGEVLVCRTTAPPWTPLFAIAGAVVTDSGGVLSHSAICAREYAIPCVVATQVATSVIKDGMTLTVDGTKGIVRIEG